ncbi:MAG: hypothetical protein ACLRT5_04890 [Lachnospiraceae bacterium]
MIYTERNVPGCLPGNRMVTGEVEEEENLKPQQTVNSFQIRPGFYDINGATGFPNGVNFTLISRSATSCCLLLFHRGSQTPYARIPFPEEYRMGIIYSMFVFGLKSLHFRSGETGRLSGSTYANFP